MKNKLLTTLIGFFILITLLYSKVLSQEFSFEAGNIQNINEKIIKASEKVFISDNKGIKIYAEEFTYNKEKKIFIILDNVIFLDENNLLNINSNKIEFDEINNVITTFGETKISQNQKYELIGEDILYNRNNKNISSIKKAEITDDLNNFIKIEGFNISLTKNLLITNKAKIIDNESNIYEIDQLYYDFKKQNILGKDILVNNNNTLSSKRFLPRIKGRSLIFENGNSTIKKIIATNCEKKDGCPPWSIEAEEIAHNKEKKIINYKKAKLKLYDIPVLYFPKFFHPDPTVSRQSGFLPPTISTQNSSSYLLTPYFYAISNYSDFTFSPRFYDNQENLYQGEYRHLTKNSSSTIDASIKSKNSFISKNDSSQSHFFINSSFNSNFEIFDFSKFELQFQNVSNEKYLKTFDLRSPIISSLTDLKSFLNFEGYSDDMELSISSEVYEDLNKEKNSDRFEHIAPNFSFSKTFKTNLSGTLSMINTGYNKLFDTNKNEKTLINDLKYKSIDYINNKGFINNFELILKNFNADSKNSTTFKNKSESNLQGLIQFNSKLPLKKEGLNYFSTLTPIFSAKINPNPNKNISKNSRIIDYSNIFSSNRISSNETLEGGESITIGNEYKIFSNKKPENEIFGLNLGTSFRRTENDDLPTNSFLNKKSSNVVGQMNLKTNEFIEFNYDFSSDNNLGEMNYHKVNSSFKVNNFVTTFEFIEENNEIGDESFISNETTYKIDNNKNIKFKTRKNKKTDLTEYYNLLYQYKIDCLVAGIEYNKKYYSDGGLRPEESIFFSITLMPFDNTIDLPGIDK